jgi:peptidoglycan/xylan/chitin deacetylase (PgdA/CDA1 family)
MKPLDLTAIMYHYVRDPGDAAEAGSGIAGLPTVDFETQLDLLARNYEMVDWPAVRAHLLGERALPAKACLLTFDDGSCDHYLNVFPRLRARGMSGLFFVMARPDGSGLTVPHRLHFLYATLGFPRVQSELGAALNPAQLARQAEAAARYQAGAKSFALNQPDEAYKLTLQRELLADVTPTVDRLLAAHVGDSRALAERYFISSGQMREMAAGGMHFGGHSETHPWLDFEDDATVARELRASAEWLAQVESGPFAFAYPYGGYDERTSGALRAAGFGAAFTTRAQVQHDSEFHIGRLDGEWLPPAGTGDAEWLVLEADHA